MTLVLFWYLQLIMMYESASVCEFNMKFCMYMYVCMCVRVCVCIGIITRNYMIDCY
jgi:hypothetical protein